MWQYRIIWNNSLCELLYELNKLIIFGIVVSFFGVDVVL